MNKLLSIIYFVFVRRLCKPQFMLVIFIYYIMLTIFCTSCRKLVEVSPPTNSITTSQAFSTDELARAAVMGVYHKMINASGDNFSNGVITLYCGATADEVEFFSSGVQDDIQFQLNNLTATNSKIANNFWGYGFSILYAANSIIDGLRNSVNVSDSVKIQLIAQAKFVRAFCNFYLTNLFGDIPLVIDINWHNTSQLLRRSTSEVYEGIVSDLLDAQNVLLSDYQASNGQRIIPNKWAATALLARVYLYKEDWANAEVLSNSIIENSSLFSLCVDLNDVFKINSTESILQLQQSNTVWPYNATQEGNRIIPYDANSSPFIYLTPYLMNSFESGDNRRGKWVDSTTYLSTKYYYPQKFKVGSGQAVPNGQHTEYYTVFRLAEQYLIRAEARLKRNRIQDATSDINVIRNRAGLNMLPSNLISLQVEEAIEKEKRIEYFCEWGHRWLDLKRWNKADSELSQIKGPNWQNTDQLYPIPQGELTISPSLTQNPGY